MTERVGRHASHDPGETLVLHAISPDGEPPYVPPSTGRHASGRSEDGTAEDAEAVATVLPERGVPDAAAEPAGLQAVAAARPAGVEADAAAWPDLRDPDLAAPVSAAPASAVPVAEQLEPLPRELAERSALAEPVAVAEPAAVLEPVSLPEPVAVPEPAALPEPVVLRDRVPAPEPEAGLEPWALHQPEARREPAALPEPSVRHEAAVLPDLEALPEPAAPLEPAALLEPGESGGHGAPNGQLPANGQLPQYVYPEEQIPAADLASPSRSGGSRRLRLVWVYPDLLSTYGDRGNLLVLIRRARLRGLEVVPVEVKSDEPVPDDGDIYLLGGGEDLPQILAAARLRADGGLQRAAEGGAVVFAVCAGYQLIGRQFGGVEGEPVAGLGILDVTSGRGDRRGVGEIVADVDPALGVPRLTGFENHQGVTQIGPGARPLARVTLGVGNGDGTEGAHAGRVLGTYLHGPALARNPGLADLLLSWAAGPLATLNPAAEDWARRLREERLAATSS
jgi:lipid II isoglutaminyl synthase (glutamine-hydrolysing)